MRLLILAALTFGTISSTAHAKLIPDTPPTLGAMQAACDDWLRGLASSRSATCQIYMSGELNEVKADGACPPTSLTPSNLAYAFNRYAIAIATDGRERDKSWRSFSGPAWRSAWPC